MRAAVRTDQASRADNVAVSSTRGAVTGQHGRLQLLPQHQRLVDASAISDEVAAERGYRSVTKRVDLERLGFGRKQCRVPALVLPVYNYAGEIALYQARSDDPRIGGNGKPIKYETPGKARMVLDVPPRVRGKLGDPGIPLYITEGVRKADAAASIGLACIGLLGVWNWRGTNDHGGKTALADWESVALNDREVYIVFDSDVTMKHEVRTALGRLKTFLESRKARVQIVSLPSGNDRGKVGLDDFLAAGHGVDKLLRLASPELPGIGAAPESECPYQEAKEGIIWQKPTGNGAVAVRVTNFTARIEGDVSRDDGAEVTRVLEIRAQLDSREARFSVPASRFASMNWPMEHLGPEAVVYAGYGARDHARAAIQLLSGSVPPRRVFTHTGWTRIDDRWVYLHGSGGIGEEGAVEGVEVDLPVQLSAFRFESSLKGCDLTAAVRASIDLLNLAPDHVVAPLLAAVYRSVLGTSDFSLFVTGPTGARKSELAARLMQHFGSEFARTGLPAWSSTGNFLEVLAFVAKDTTLVVDDFSPTGAAADVQRLHREADRLLRGQGNLAGRGRLSSDGSPRPTRCPRGLIINTGEDVPNGQSLRARMLIVGVGPDDVDLETLTQAQEAGADGLYAAAMKGFIQWLAPRYDNIRAELRSEVPRLRDEMSQGTRHLRTPGIAADLCYGLKKFTVFAEDVGVLGQNEADDLQARVKAALTEVMAAQGDFQVAGEPTTRFLDLLRSSLSSGEAHVAGEDGEAPKDWGSWGWRKQGEMPKPTGCRVGWVVGDDVYLDRGAAYKACQTMTGGAVDGLSVSSHTLVKRLQERGLLKSKEARRKSLLVRRELAGARRYVIHLDRQTIFPT